MATINRNPVLSQKNAQLIDARGPRFSATLTTIVLGSALVTHSIILIGLQLVVFTIGAFLGPQKTPYAWVFKKYVKPRLSGDVPTEDVRPPQFAQKVGFLFAAVALSGSLLGIGLLFTIATGFALAAAFLNAAFNFCLGCEMYLLMVRATNRSSIVK
jgi:hypothetical protein